MSEQLTRLFNDYDRGRLTRRQLLQALGIATVVGPITAGVRPLLAQGSCGGARKGTPQCDQTPAKLPFEATGWKTVWLDHFSMQVGDYQKEAAYYATLMNWKIRSDDGTKALLDIGDDVGGLLIRGGYTPPPPPPQPPADPNAAAAAGGAAGAAGAAGGRGGGRGGAGGGGGRGGPRLVLVDGFCWGIDQWDAKKVESELKKRGLNPVADNDSKSNFESFHVTDPGGFDLQISNGNKKNRRPNAASGKMLAPAPFEPTAWKTIWLDHISFQCPDYKASAAFYNALLGWKLGDDEGSQNEVQIGEGVGNAIIRGTNMSPAAVQARAEAAAAGTAPTGRGGGAGQARKASIDHIAFGITPWDPDAVKAELDKRGLSGSPDTGNNGDIHTAPYQSYHTNTPNGFNLQISNATKANRNTR
jgi:catechol 2,3-dioxygenase-like lactoylglutathione lyase family enzyme